MTVAKEAPPTPRAPVKLKVSPAVAAYMKGRDVVGLKIPLVFPPGQRLWMIECGPSGRTGRADLCTVIGTDGNLLLLDRRFCWSQGKFDDDLSGLSLTVDPGEFSMVESSAIPQEAEDGAGHSRESKQPEGA